jgi:hypothetical protein
MLPKPAATVRKHPKQERSQATVEAILTATARILTEQGYATIHHQSGGGTGGCECWLAISMIACH